jgi:plasmid stabilization system protein ParE
MKLEFHPEAEMELIEAAAHYELQVLGLGERFESEVRRATDILLEHSDIGSPADPHLRRFILNRFDARELSYIYSRWGCFSPGSEGSCP